MADAWTKVELYGQNNDGDPRRYTCASGTAIAKGTLLQLTDPRTASAHSGAAQRGAGVAAMAKSATDGATTITAWTNGIFEAVASGVITAGSAIEAGINVNVVKTTGASGAVVLGYALETSSEGETINVRLSL